MTDQLRSTPLTPDERAAINEFAMTQGKPIADITDQLAQALEDMLSGWRYIRSTHGDLYGVGWDRCEQSADKALAYRASKEGEVEYQMLTPGVRIQEGDEWMEVETVWHKYSASSVGSILNAYRHNPSRRPIRAT